MMGIHLNDIFNRTNMSTTAETNHMATQDNQRDAIGMISNEVKILLCFFYSLIFLFGMLGNGLVCYAIVFKSKQSHRGEVFLLSLATADLLKENCNAKTS